MNCVRVILFAFVLLALPGLNRAAPPAQFVVLRIVNHDKSETNLVMSLSDAQALQTELRAEAQLFTRAQQAAITEWKKDEDLRKSVFPSAEITPRQASILGPPYDTEQKAAAALSAATARQHRNETKKKKSKATEEKEGRMAQALDLLADQLAVLKGGDTPSTSNADKIDLKPGQSLSRKTEGPSQTSYHIAVPDSFSASNPPPLLIVFSPGGDGRGLMNQVRESANKAGWMVIGCDRLKNGMKSEEEIPIQGELLSDVRKYITYNRERLYYGGFSGGAMRAYHMTWQHKEPCAGILAFGGWLGLDDTDRPFQKRMAVAMVNGEGDKGALQYEKRDKDILAKRRCEVNIFHFPGGHGVAPRETIDKAIQWMDAESGTK